DPRRSWGPSARLVRCQRTLADPSGNSRSIVPATARRAPTRWAAGVQLATTRAPRAGAVPPELGAKEPVIPAPTSQRAPAGAGAGDALTTGGAGGDGARGAGGGASGGGRRNSGCTSLSQVAMTTAAADARSAQGYPRSSARSPIVVPSGRASVTISAL